jgi:hypothetical protein
MRILSQIISWIHSICTRISSWTKNLRPLSLFDEDVPELEYGPRQLPGAAVLRVVHPQPRLVHLARLPSQLNSASVLAISHFLTVLPTDPHPSQSPCPDIVTKIIHEFDM